MRKLLRPPIIVTIENKHQILTFSSYFSTFSMYTTTYHLIVAFWPPVATPTATANLIHGCM